MDILMLPGRPEDLPEAMEALREEFLLRDHDNRQRCVTFWARLLEQRRAFFDVTVDQNAPIGRAERIIGASLHLFVTVDFAGELRSGLHPFVLMRLLDLERDGRLPVLRAQEIRDANAPGDNPSLIMLVFAGLLSKYMRTDAGIAVREQGSQFAAFTAAGYNLAEFFIEAHGSAWLARSQLQGMSIRTDNRPGLVSSNLPTGVPENLITDEEYHPYLMGITRAEAMNPGGGAMGRLFAYVAPRCRFTAAEQELLRYALSGITDEALARQLRLSPPTVRKRWRDIYERLSDTIPDMLQPPAGLAVSTKLKAPSSGRSTEKKRRLLNYLRSHLEELRPASFPSGA